MSNVADTTASNVLGNYDIANKTTTPKKSNDLGQAAFLELMITQMKNQDPLSPQSNSEFVAQLAQFSSVEGLEKLNTNFSSFTGNFMSNQALQASSLVGRSVSVEGTTSILGDGGIVSGSYNLPASTKDLKINISDEKGSSVASIPVGSSTSGDHTFRWDGQNIEVDGQLLDWTPTAAAKPGTYKFEVTATQDGKTTSLGTNLSANVNSVTLGTDGKLVLNLAGIGPIDMSKVKQFN